MSSNTLSTLSNVRVTVTKSQAPADRETKVQPYSTRSSLPNEEMRKLLLGYFEALDVSYTPTPPCQTFHKACYDDMDRRGWSRQTVEDLEPYFPSGAMISLTAYDHLENLQTKVLIANYTTLLIYLDDLYDDHIEEIKLFNVKFMQNQPHGHRVLDALALLLQDLPLHFGEASRIILTSTMNYMTAMILEHEVPDTLSSCSKSAAATAKYVRQLSGVAEPYGLFAFPPTIPWTSYVHALPDMVYFISSTNDVLSLYKEELRGELTNTISILAACEGTSKIDMAHKIGVGAINSDSVVRQLIKNPEARAAWDHFREGYVKFHTSLARYKLTEILRD